MARASATVRGCKIVDNRDVGAAAQDGATLVVERSVLARNGQGGVALIDATPTSRIEDNDIDENGEAGLVVFPSSTLVSGTGSRTARRS